MPNCTIHKYQLKVTDRQLLELPEGSRTLACKEQDGNLCLWVYLDTEEKLERLEILILGTGNPAPSDLKDTHFFIDTVQMSNGLVWHVFGTTY